MLTQEEKHREMIETLRREMMDEGYKRNFMKAQLTRITHLLDKYPDVILTEEEEDRLCEIK
jgi:hypothetical protein